MIFGEREEERNDSYPTISRDICESGVFRGGSY